MQYASRSGNCVRITPKLPCGRRNLKRIRGSMKTFGWAPIVCTLTAKRWMASTATRRSLGSEEHTSELQSLMRISYDVCCLKKNKQHLDETYSTSSYQYN